MLVSSDASLEGKLFVEFLALIYLSYIKKQMSEKNLFNQFTIQGLLDEVDLIECFTEPGKSHTVWEILQKQRQIFKHMDVMAPDSIASLWVDGNAGYTLSIDRTNRSLGKPILMSLPLLSFTMVLLSLYCLFQLMPKRGNSNTAERIAIVNRFIRLLGCESINYLVADREFVGEDWLEYLNTKKIRYHLRIRGNFHTIRQGKEIKIS